MRRGYTETHKRYQNLRHHRERERERMWVSDWERDKGFDPIEWEEWNERCQYKDVNNGYNDIIKPHYSSPNN